MSINYPLMGRKKIMNAVVKPKATLLDLDALMDTPLDSVETMPDYMNPPAGNYVLVAKEAKIEKFDVKDDGKKTGEQGNRIKITYAVVKTEEVIAGELPVPDGTLFTESFQGTEEGLKYCKKACANILGVKEFDGAKLGEILEAVKDQEFRARITVRTTDGENGKKYENINIRALPAA